MTLLFIFAASLGFIMGAWCRVFWLLLIIPVTFIAAFAVADYQGYGTLEAIVSSIAGATTVQVCYFLGALARTMISRSA